MKSPAHSDWWQNQHSRCGRLAARSAEYETNVSQIVAALPESVADSFEPGPARRPGACARIGWAGAGRRAGHAGFGQVARTNPGHGGLARLPDKATHPAYQAGGNLLCRGDHAHRENASHRPGGCHPVKTIRRDTETAHRSTGRLEPGTECGDHP